MKPTWLAIALLGCSMMVGCSESPSHFVKTHDCAPIRHTDAYTYYNVADGRAERMPPYTSYVCNGIANYVDVYDKDSK